MLPNYHYNTKEQFLKIVQDMVASRYTCTDPGAKVVHYDDGNPYAVGWVIVECPEFSLYVHKFHNYDNCGTAHDHPWDSVSLCIEGSMTEKYRLPGEKWKQRHIKTGDLIFRPAKTAHLLPFLEGESATTLFLAGPIIREAGFHCPQGVVPFLKFRDMGNKCLALLQKR